ncbi:hypothetical protein MPL3356_250078 [Mesorhizobium plurifarium]|uniref:Uncharacterized protein n=1 Tax=Mesorhizobium plurifarium TaxID=69974 RepID=A0A090DUJ4_MESPL|nr:hypothetical protein MPL3356_250078 [Mesorhizobium plurifarium]
MLQGVDPDATAANQRDLDSCHAVPCRQAFPNLLRRWPYRHQRQHGWHLSAGKLYASETADSYDLRPAQLP